MKNSDSYFSNSTRLQPAGGQDPDRLPVSLLILMPFPTDSKKTNSIKFYTARLSESYLFGQTL